MRAVRTPPALALQSLIDLKAFTAVFASEDQQHSYLGDTGGAPPTSGASRIVEAEFSERERARIVVVILANRRIEDKSLARADKVMAPW
jgi:hypothetical protein